MTATSIPISSCPKYCLPATSPTDGSIGRLRFLGIFAHAALMFLIALASHDSFGSIAMASTSTDMSMIIVVLSAVIYLIAMICVNAESTLNTHKLATIVSLAAISLTFKLSAAILCSTLVLCALIFELRRTRPADGPTLSRIIQEFRIFAPAIIIVAAWLGRGATLTGYPLFPSTIISQPADWTMDPGRVDKIRSSTRQWALQGKFKHLSWQDRVWDRQHRFFYGPIFGAMIAALLIIVRRKNVWFRETKRGAYVVFASTLPALLFWACTVPSPRFAMHLLWLITVTLAAISISPSKHSTGPSHKRVPAVWILFLVSFGIFRFTEIETLRSRRGLPTPSPFVSTLLVDPIYYQYSRTLPEPELAQEVTRSGLKVWRPTQDNRTWSAPLPATPTFSDSLRLRRPGELASGFAIQKVGG